MKALTKSLITGTLLIGVFSTSHAELPNPGLDVITGRTALVITDP